MLEELNVGSYDVAIVSLGQSIEASTLVTLHLRELGVRRIIVKAISPDHQKLLEKVGADLVVEVPVVTVRERFEPVPD